MSKVTVKLNKDVHKAFADMAKEKGMNQSALLRLIIKQSEKYELMKGA
jgi:antitoxin component of RelBE/YafQ-DinJ toxin-antitoxin module